MSKTCWTAVWVFCSLHWLSRRNICNAVAWEQIIRDWLLFKINILTVANCCWKSTFQGSFHRKCPHRLYISTGLSPQAELRGEAVQQWYVTDSDRVCVAYILYVCHWTRKPYLYYEKWEMFSWPWATFFFKEKSTVLFERVANLNKYKMKIFFRCHRCADLLKYIQYVTHGNPLLEIRNRQ